MLLDQVQRSARSSRQLVEKRAADGVVAAFDQGPKRRAIGRAQAVQRTETARVESRIGQGSGLVECHAVDGGELLQSFAATNEQSNLAQPTQSELVGNRGGNTNGA